MCEQRASLSSRPAHEGDHRSVNTGDLIIDTPNFYKVLEHFDDNGNLIDGNSRISIACSICLVKNLGLFGRQFDESPHAAYEHYAVLVRCGHAFGYRCLVHWFLIVCKCNELKCPICRAPVLCERKHWEPLEILGGSTADRKIQCDNIKRIREVLKTPICKGCMHPLLGTRYAGRYEPVHPPQHGWAVQPFIPPRSSSLRRTRHRGNVPRANGLPDPRVGPRYPSTAGARLPANFSNIRTSRERRDAPRSLSPSMAPNRLQSDHSSALPGDNILEDSEAELDWLN
ncbi:hypothetical protein F4824DRAFT_91585 [Ustulina deusta]|nr:hypothetical protein F4824DRAFT_91585 [Ustulina deusta]